MSIATINPADGRTLRTFEALEESGLDARLARAAEAFSAYRRTTFEQRSGWMRSAADLLDADGPRVAALMTTEMGKTLRAARQETAKCAAGCRYYADRAASMLADQPVDPGPVGARRALVRWRPLGPVLAVMPWNFPLWQAMRFAAPALMAGNVALLKHASNVPQTALYLQELFERAGF
ncbi:MAG: aldehyde dehydrogenase family protein, partial [Actinomycetota bacterium]|nr:aldehyde dehydrogenase family protein [Actinomycetota bacterium]